MRRRNDTSREVTKTAKFKSEPYIQIVQRILSEEFKEPAVNFRVISEKIITELKTCTEEQVKKTLG